MDITHEVSIDDVHTAYQLTKITLKQRRQRYCRCTFDGLSKSVMQNQNVLQ